MSQADLRRALAKMADKREPYDEFRDYDNGDQPIMFASDKFRRFYEAVMRRYRLNICRTVVRQTARRLDIDTWEGDDGTTDWWQQQGLRLQNRLYRETVRQGDGYLLVWPQDTMQGQLKTNRLRADEAIVIYSEEDPDRPEFAVKLWTVTDTVIGPDGDRDRERLRANVYRPEGVTRWVTSSWSGRMDQASDTAWDEYHGDGETDQAGHEIAYDGPLREAASDGVLPLQHFPCQPDDTPYGTSVLSDVLPVQDALNKHAIDILVTSEQYGLPLRAALGMEEIKETYEDDDGNKVTTSNLDIDYDPRLDYFLALPGAQSKLVQLPEADLTKLLEVKRAAIQDATLVSNVPLLLLAEDSGSIPAGVALREVKAPLTELVEDIQQDLTVPWSNVAKLHGFDAQPGWSAPFTMDEVERWELAQLKIDAGWPARQAIIETGLDPEFVDEVFAAAVDGEADVGRRLMRAFRDGQDPAQMVRQ